MKLVEESGRDALPEFFKDYTLQSCLKYTAETRVYLVEKGGERYILKRAEGTFAAPLREEYAVLAALDYDFLPRTLGCVELEGSSVTDFTPLGEMPALRRLVCDRTQERLIRTLYPDPPFEIEAREE